MTYLILGTGTDIGKSFLVENLCRILPKVAAIKPICTGFSDHDKNSDPARILTALGREISKENLDEITPWRFEEACSPHFLKEEIDFKKIVNFCQKEIIKNKGKTLLIEAAGGVMTPINNEKTFLDLAAELQIPTLLVTGNYLGAISHTLSAIGVLKTRGISVEKIIVNDQGKLEESKYSIEKTLEDFTGIESLSLKDFLINQGK